MRPRHAPSRGRGLFRQVASSTLDTNLMDPLRGLAKVMMTDQCRLLFYHLPTGE